MQMEVNSVLLGSQYFYDSWQNIVIETQVVLHVPHRYCLWYGANLIAKVKFFIITIVEIM